MIRPCARALSRIRPKSSPAPSSGQLDRDFVALLADVERYFAGFLFARIPPRLAALDAMIQRIAQQVFERSDQLFQHRTIELDLRAAYLEIRAFVESSFAVWRRMR